MAKELTRPVTLHPNGKLTGISSYSNIATVEFQVTLEDYRSMQAKCDVDDIHQKDKMREMLSAYLGA